MRLSSFDFDTGTERKRFTAKNGSNLGDKKL